MSATVLVGFLLSFTAIAYAGIPVWVQYISNITGFVLAASLLLPFIRSHAFPISPLDKWIVLYTLWFALSFIWSGHRYVSRLEFFNLLTGLAVFYTAVGIGSSESGQKHLEATLILLGIFVISAITAGGLLKNNLWPNVSYLMLNPNIVAGYLATMLPAFGGVILARIVESRHVRVFGLITISLGLTLLLFTGSIWGLVSLFAALLVILYVQKRDIKIPLTLFLCILAVIFAGRLVPVNSIVDRLEWWQAGIKALWNNIVFGLGPGVFSEAYRGFAGNVSQPTLYVHNFFIQSGAEIGLPGLILWLLVLLNWLRWFLSQKLTVAKTGAVMAILALCIHNLADYSLNLPAHRLLFWFLLGSSCPAVYIKKPQRLPVILRIFLLTILISLGTHISQLFAAWHKINVAKIEVAKGSLTRARTLARQAVKLDRISPEGYALLARIELESYKQDGMNSHLYRAANFLTEALSRSPYSLELKRDLRQVHSLLI